VTVVVEEIAGTEAVGVTAGSFLGLAYPKGQRIGLPFYKISTMPFRLSLLNG
jgi:hypothetical protein